MHKKNDIIVTYLNNQECHLHCSGVIFIPKIKGSIDMREDKIRKDLEEAKTFKEQAELKLNEYNSLMETAKIDVKKIISKSRQKLNEDMIMLKEMFIDLQQITSEQEPLIDDILDNVDETNNNTEQAVVELREAQNYQVNMFGYKLAVLGSLVGALIGGPIGFVVLGTKIATGIGATTCGVVGLIGGNRVSKNYREPDI